MPHFTRDTIIIGLCGVDDVVAASPQRDGRFVSDFFAAWYLFRRLGSRQRWILSMKASDLVDTYTEYLHGPPDGARRVVLSRNMLEELGSEYEHGLHVVGGGDLAAEFLGTLREAVGAAGKSTTPMPIAIFAFGHGDVWTGGLQVGPCRLPVSEMRGVIGDKADVALISPACYSGGWAMATLCDAAAAYQALGAAGKGKVRVGPTAFGAGLVDILAGSASPVLEEFMDGTRVARAGFAPLPALDGGDLAKYRRFAQAVEEAILVHHRCWLEEWGFKHTSRDDMARSAWTGRRDIPLGVLNSRWRRLERRAPAAASVPAERGGIPAINPATTRAARRCGLTVRQFARYVQRLAEQHLECCPGAWSGAYGGEERDMLRALAGAAEPGLTAVGEVRSWLAFRSECIVLADLLLEIAGIPQPMATRCADFDEAAWARLTLHRDGQPSALHRSIYQDIVAELHATRFWPRPGLGQGRFWGYPLQYIAAGLFDCMMAERRRAGEISGMILAMARVYDRLVGKMRKELLKDTNMRDLAVEWIIACEPEE